MRFNVNLEEQERLGGLGLELPDQQGLELLHQLGLELLDQLGLELLDQLLRHVVGSADLVVVDCRILPEFRSRTEAGQRQLQPGTATGKSNTNDTQGIIFP